MHVSTIQPLAQPFLINIHVKSPLHQLGVCILGYVCGRGEASGLGVRVVCMVWMWDFVPVLFILLRKISLSICIDRLGQLHNHHVSRVYRFCAIDKRK